MEKLTAIKDLLSNPAELWSLIQDNSQHVLQLVQAHPWSSLTAATATVVLWKYIKAPRNLPPGPRGWPVVGCMAGLELDLAAKALDWRDTYGDIISLYCFGQLRIIVNNEQLIREAFLKHGEELAHRDMTFNFILKEGLLSGPYDEALRKNKKFAFTTLKNHGFGTMKSVEKVHNQFQYLEEFLMKSKGSPIEPFSELKNFFIGLITAIVLGRDYTWEDPPRIELSKKLADFNQCMSDHFMGFYMYHLMFPLKLTNMLTRKTASIMESTEESLKEFIAKEIQIAAADIKKQEPENVVDAYLKEHGCEGKTLKVLATTILTFFPDAVDTTSILASWTLFYLALYPEVQERVHKEVLAVCGPGRAPTLADRAEMPYLQAVLYETLRLNLVVALSFPRVLQQDMKFGGYTFPKGSFVSANFYAIHFDPKIFPDPKAFNPSRFLDENGKFITSLGGKNMTFSIGNRMCMGENYYKVSVFIFLAQLMQRFKFEFDPSEPKPSLAKDTSFYINKPQPHKLCFTPC